MLIYLHVCSYICYICSVPANFYADSSYFCMYANGSDLFVMSMFISMLIATDICFWHISDLFVMSLQIYMLNAHKYACSVSMHISNLFVKSLRIYMLYMLNANVSCSVLF